MSNGFGLNEQSKPTRVSLVAGPDADMEDESHQPPMFRERYIDQSNVFLNADYSNQMNPSANTSQWNIGSDTTKGRKNKGFFAGRIKKFTPTFLQLSHYATNINPRNNTIEFQVYRADLNSSTDVYVATIAPYNYTQLITNYYNGAAPAYPTLPAYEVCDGIYGTGTTWAPLAGDVRGDPNDGLIDHILTAMNNAVHKTTGAPYNPATVGHGQFLASFSNGYHYDNVQRNWNRNTGDVSIGEQNDYGRIYCSGVAPNIGGISFRMTGGTTFQKGLHAWGCKPLPNIPAPNVIPVESPPNPDSGTWPYDIYMGGPPTVRNPLNPINPFSFSYLFGPAQFQYSRWIDIVMPELLQFSKMQSSGSGVPSNLLARLYNSDIQRIGLENVILSDFRQQQINMRKDFALSYLNVEIRDEYGELFEVPGGQAVSTSINLSGVLDWPNSNGITIGLCAQL